MKNILLFLISIGFIFSLMACNKDLEITQSTAINDFPNDSSKNESLAAVPLSPSEMSLFSQSVALPEDLISAITQCVVDDQIWVAGLSNRGVVLGYCMTDGSQFEVEVPENVEFIYALCSNDEGVIALGGSFPAAYFDGNNELIINSDVDGELCILTYSFSGELVSKIQLEHTYAGPNMTFSQMLCFDNAYYLLCQNMVILIDSNGIEQNRFLTDERDCLSMCMLNNELVIGAATPVGLDSVLFIIEPSDLTMKTVHELQGIRLTGVGIDHNGLLLCTDIELLRFDCVNSTSQVIVSWADLYVTDKYTQIQEFGLGWIVFSRHQRSITVIEYREQTARINLTIATDISHGHIHTLANNFNSIQNDYKIIVNVYDDEVASIDALRTQVLAGNSPDIFAFSQDSSFADIDEELYLTDLYTYLGDNKENLLPSILKAIEENNKLYWLPYRFDVITFSVPEELWGESGISIAQAEILLSELGNDWGLFEEWVTPDVSLQWFCNYSMDSFVVNGGFDTEKFIAILELCNQWTTSNSEQSFLKFENIQSLNRISALSAQHIGEYCFAGFPGASGNGSAFRSELRLAISSQSTNKQGAWHFLDYCVSENGQTASAKTGFPVNIAVWESVLSNAVETEKITSADADKLRSLLTSTTSFVSPDGSVLDIINEEAPAYFDGDKSAEEVAAIIQNRVQTYIAEQG